MLQIIFLGDDPRGGRQECWVLTEASDACSLTLAGHVRVAVSTTTLKDTLKDYVREVHIVNVAIVA